MKRTNFLLLWLALANFAAAQMVEPEEEQPAHIRIWHLADGLPEKVMIALRNSRGVVTPLQLKMQEGQFRGYRTISEEKYDVLVTRGFQVEEENLFPGKWAVRQPPLVASPSFDAKSGKSYTLVLQDSENGPVVQVLEDKAVRKKEGKRQLRVFNFTDKNYLRFFDESRTALTQPMPVGISTHQLPANLGDKIFLMPYKAGSGRVAIAAAETDLSMHSAYDVVIQESKDGVVSFRIFPGVANASR